MLLTVQAEGQRIYHGHNVINIKIRLEQTGAVELSFNHNF